MFEAENGQFVRIGPENGPGLSAPLGWVLSETTMDDLDQQLDDICDAAARRALRLSTERPTHCQPETPSG